MKLVYREDYWDDRDLKTEFTGFLNSLFGIDLAPWDRAGFWDTRYRPFSYFDGRRLVANVCAYSMDMTVLGRRCRVAQISAVGTLPEYRRQGLSRELTAKALAWAQNNHEFFFLFADDEAIPFYQSCGFRQVDECKTRLQVRGMTASAGAVKLDMERKEHVERLYHLAACRAPVSEVLGVHNERLFMFWCLCGLRQFIVEIPALETVVLLRREPGLLTILDIVAARMPTFDELYPYLAASDTEFVDFLFMTDKLGLRKTELIRVEGNGTHLKGQIPFEGTPFIFPFTAHA